MTDNNRMKAKPLGGSSNVFSGSYQSQAQRQDRSYFKRLYNFNANVELAEFSLPFELSGQNQEGANGKMAPGVVNSTQLAPIDQDGRAAQMQMDYDQMDGQRQVLYDMDGNEILEDEYGNELGDVMDPEAYGEEEDAGAQGEDDLGYEEFEALIEQQEDESSNKIAELRAANYVGSKGTPMWHLRNSIQTGEQAISFFAKYGSNMPIKFLNCNRREVGPADFRPYDLVTTQTQDPKELNQEYFTISAQGVVQVFQDKNAAIKGAKKNHVPTEFLSLPEWMQQSTMFNVLTSMKFFKHYLIGKVFRLWKGNVRYRMYNRTRQDLAKTLIFARPDFLPEFMAINRVIYEMQSKLTFQVEKKAHSYDLEVFMSTQRNHHEEAKNWYRNKVDEEIKQNLCNLTKKISDSRTLREEEDLENSKKGKAEKKKSIVLQKEERNLKNQVLHLARDNYKSLGTFIRLIDYRVVEAQVRINQESAEFILSEMENDKKKYAITTWVEFDSPSGMSFQPDKSSFKTAIEKLLHDMKGAVEDIQPINLHSDLQQFINGLITDTAPRFSSIVEKSYTYKMIQKSIEDHLADDFSFLEEETKKFEECRSVHQFEQTWKFEDFIADENAEDLETIKALFDKWNGWELKITKYIQQFILSGLVKAEGKKLRDALQTKVKKELSQLRKHLYGIAEKTYIMIDKNIQKMNTDLKRDNKNLEQYVQFVRGLKQAEETLKECEEHKQKLENMKMCLQKNRDKDQTASTLGAQTSVQTLQARIENITTDIDSLHEELKNANSKAEMNRDANLNSLTQEVEKQQALIREQIDSLDSEVLTQPNVAPAQALSELQRIKKKYDGYNNKIKEFQDNEEVLNAEHAAIPEVEAFETRYEKRFTLWNNRNIFTDQQKKWYLDPFEDQDAESIVKQVQEYQSQNITMKMKLKKGEKDEVLAEFSSEVQAVVDHSELIKALGCKDLQQRHWDKIFKRMESNFLNMDRRDLTLNRMIEDHALDHQEYIQEVSGTAMGEAKISAEMDEVKDRWAVREFVVTQYRDSKDRFIIKEVEDVITELEDDIMTVSAMMGNRNVNEIRNEVEDWERKLGYISDTIDEWLTFQRSWMYLENIFNAEDIQTAMKAETKQFQQVDKFWKEHMNKTKKDSKVIAQADGGPILKKFQENNKRLDEIQKGLEDYLGTKRASFPRFYFLSNDDLIEILSQTRNVHAVQPHLMKCFDAMKKIEFTKEKNSKEIIGMWSPELEYVEFSESVIAQGPVEFWLKAIESMMTQSLFDQTKGAVNQYPVDITKRADWLFQFPAQPILTVDMIMWTKGVTEAITEIQSGLSESALKEWLVKTNAQLDDMIILVRGELNSLQRAAMGAILVLDVHAQFIVEQMIKSQLNNLNDFLWTSQLRYYWEALTDLDGEPFRGDDTDLDTFCKQTNTRFRYGYEYLGNGPRLVITPLTDKCYMTLTGALHSNYGGNPQGPAGTGKTETTKDLAKALAIQCVVFNCGDGLDTKMMARFFTGLASGGAWSCFDEFNRIFIEVLSVIAQQILTIQSAVKERKTEFMFDDRQIPLNLRFGVFITMNPGYAGRTELPDNLNALFRPISMMIPDYGLIAQIYLFADGFSEANDLSKKMVKLYSLSSEQLSKQDHYDFGMRAVKSVLVMAGKLRRKSPDAPEDQLLIRAMRDSNVPKFLEHDLPLFEGIITDLFPTSKKPDIDNARLQSAIKQQLEGEKLQYVEKFVAKIIQLLETMTVRHGNMLVGSTGTGKTTCAKILGKALQQLYEDGHRDDAFYQPVDIKTLYPKAVRMGELFGETNVFTAEWKEGIVSKLVKDAVNAMEEKNVAHWKRWILFDGPVDALWIENMNTVLDDNKMLCLNNGQRIRMPDTCTMMFEVNDLKVASPATVSRCGMVYLEPIHLGWKPLLKTWVQRMENVIDTDQLVRIETMVEDYLDKTLTKISTMKQPIQAEVNNLVQSCLRLIHIFLNKDAIKLEGQETDADKIVNNYVAFSIIWSVGANIHDSDRNKFNVFFRTQLTKADNTDFDANTDVYEQGIDPKTHKFQKWDEQINEHYIYDPKQNFFEILVPTNDTVKYKFLLQKILMNGHNALIMGETGVGKSVITKNFLVNAPENLLSTFINFSGKTSTSNLVDAVEGNLDALRKNMLQPKAGKKMVFFIDDVNMPQLDRYGSQPPCELLRQIIDQGGYYDLDKLFFKHVRETKFVSACAPPSGGRNPVSPRLFRHFNMFWVPDLSPQSMKQIFSQILKGYLSMKEDGTLASLADLIVKAAVEIYQNVIKDFLPTPAKCHYTFNLRDLSKVVQGMLMCDGRVIEDKEYLVKLYMCETYRVFRDRLIDAKDRQKFSEDSHEVLENYLGLDWELPNFQNVIFGDFDNGDSYYMKLGDLEELRPKLADLLSFYNMQNTPMDLVFFEDCVQHLARIARILRQQRGNAMLVGVGGSGRRSMAMFGGSFSKMVNYQIEITKTYSEKDWHENIRTLLRMCALEDQTVQFLFSDTQIVFESFLEDINNLLNSGEIPNLFAPEDRQVINDELADKAKANGIPQTREAIYAYFVQLCRERMHIVLAFSPVGDAFRDRCRQFPSIINCTTIDWYNAWPEDALYSVAYRKYEEKADALEIRDDLDVLSKCSVMLHMTVRDESEVYLSELKRNNYVTPTSYLALVKVFVTELKNQREKIPVQIQKYNNGLEKLDQVNVIVDQLKKNLETLQPEIEEKEKATQEMVIVLQEKDKIAKEKEKQTAGEAAEAATLFKKVKEIKDDCDAQLSVAMPALEKAIKALDTLKESDIGEMKGYSVPPADLVLVLDAVALLLGHKPGWDQAVKEMKQPKAFIGRLKSHDKDNMKEKILKKLKKDFINDPRFDPELIKAKSTAGRSICMWCRAMDKYAEVNKIVVPKKKALGEAEAQLSVVKKELDIKEAALREIKGELARLQSDYSKAQQQLDQLSRDKKKIELQLERAEKLVVGLAGEALRWKEAIGNLNEDQRNMLGNTVLAAGYLAYVGCFTQEYRTKLLRVWQKFLKEKGLLFSPDWSLQKILGDSLKIRTWNIQGLPSDDLSIDNGIITTYPDSRWPLIIDPQTQGNKWIKSKEKDNSLKIIKLTQGKFLLQIETAIKMGFSVLLENIGETLDPSLEPILAKNIYKKNNQLMLNLGGNPISYHNDFLFFITTKLPNPHYLPEICIKVTLLNFSVTPQGLEDQLLVEVIKIERPELELQKDNNIISLADCNRQLQDTEARILKLVNEADDNILEDEELILTLDQSKQTAIAIGERKAEAEITAEKINVSREKYRPVARRGSVLYFVIGNLSLINDMYQYSLEFFTRLFKLRLEKSEQSDELEKRLQILIDDITRAFYLSICRGLFERDKLLYSFLNTVMILRRADRISVEEWNCFLRGSPTDYREKENEASDILNNHTWVGLWGLEEAHPNFKGLVSSFKDVGDKPFWKAIMKSETPWIPDLPPMFEAKLTPFQKCMLQNVLKQTKVMGSVKTFVKEEVGPFYIESPPFDLEGCLDDSTNMAPIIFVLSPGADPIANLKKLAVDRGMDKKFESISLGQGQDVIAEKLIEEGSRAGNWVCLQNCHLFTSWMPKLEVIQEKADATQMHPEYRLWLTSNPSESFPVPVLQSGIKLTNEPPKGLKAGIMRTFTDLGEARYQEDFSKAFQYKKLVFALAFFHSVILERRKYGPIGWNVQYAWMTSDFNISEKQLMQYLTSQEQVPYVALNYLVSQVNYGGRVTDKQDVRLMNAMLKKYFCAEVMQEGYKFSALDVYFAPPDGSYQECLDYISTLPLDESPEVFGLHANANISYETALVNSFIDTILLMQPRVSGGKSSATPEQIVNNKTLEFLNQMPEVMDWSGCHADTKKEIKDGVMNSLGVFVKQEMERFNKLLKEVKKNLGSLVNAIKGTEVMSQSLEDIFNCFQNNKVPTAWMDNSIGFPSLKPLASWVQDLVDRIEFIQDWVCNGPPLTFWISTFFFPQGFMTATMQTFARATGKPIDTLAFTTHVLDHGKDEVTERPEIGIYMHGLYMQGAKWDLSKKCVEDSDPKVPLIDFPVIWLEPVEWNPTMELSPSENFECPLYKTSARKGELSTTGHSTNFVIMLNLASKIHQDYWIRRGTALLCMTDT